MYKEDFVTEDFNIDLIDNTHVNFIFKKNNDRKTKKIS